MEGLFDILRDRQLDDETCFLCGASLQHTDGSREHVFPKWLLKRFDLYNERLTLLNGTDIQYKSLTIPCCAACNNAHLSPLENRVKEGLFASDFREVPGLTVDLALWVSKLFFGILYRETGLLADRRKPESGSIVPPEFVQNLNTMHALLQALRLDVEIKGLWGEFPASVFVFDVKELQQGRSRFDFRDNLHTHSIYLRLANRVLVVCFDGGAQAEEGSEYYRDLSQHQLHPIQAAEFAAKVFYKASLFRKVPLYQTARIGDRYHINLVAMDSEAKTGTIRFVELDADQVLAVPNIPPEVLEQPMFDSWRQDDYAKVLAWFTGIPLQDLNPSPGLARAFIYNERGEFVDIPLKGP